METRSYSKTRDKITKQTRKDRISRSNKLSSISNYFTKESRTTHPSKRFKLNSTTAISTYGKSSNPLPTFHQIQSCRERKDSSGSSSSTLISYASSLQSEQKSVPDIQHHTKHEQVSTPVVERHIQPPLVDITARSQSRKRDRSKSRSPEKFDFSKSLQDPIKALESLPPTKRVRVSNSPKKTLPSTPVVQKPAPDVAPPTTTPVRPTKGMSIQERIQRLKNKQVESAKKTVVTLTPAKMDKLGGKQHVLSRLAQIKASVSPKTPMTPSFSKALDKTDLSESNIKNIETTYDRLKHRITKCVLSKIKSMLPVEFSKYHLQFEALDKIIMLLYNRKDTITLDRVMRDIVGKVQKSTFHRDTLRSISGVKADLYEYEWKKGLRMYNSDPDASERIKAESYQLVIRPNLVECLREEEIKAEKEDGVNTVVTGMESPGMITWVRMTARHLRIRLDDFVQRLFSYTYDKHTEFLMKKLGKSKDDIEATYPPENLKRWSLDFNLNAVEQPPKIQFPTKPGCLSTPSSCNGSSSPLVALRRKARGEFATTPQQTPKSTPRKVISESDKLVLDKLPESLRQKYQQRMEREQQKAMCMDEAEEKKNIAELRALFDFARILKSYFTIQRCNSTSLSDLQTHLSKQSRITPADVISHITKLSSLPSIKVDKTLELCTGFDGKKYLKLKPNTTLATLKEAITLAIERSTQQLV